MGTARVRGFAKRAGWERDDAEQPASVVSPGWLLLAAAAAGGAYLLLRPKQASTPCATTDAQVEAFAKSKGYNVWWVASQPAATWSEPKPQYTSDKMARVFSVPDCAFFKWAQNAWVVDTATAAEFAQWKKQIVK